MEQSGPRHYGPYEVLEQIGKGGMGAVYRARDSRLQRDVAIKVLHRHLSEAGARERFLREARAVSSLNHPNICTVFDIGDEDDDPFLVMELLEGESLKERLEDGAPLSQAELEAVAMQCALALAAAHAKGIVHRDIKPANLFLVKNAGNSVQLKVLDFGLAKLESDRLLYGDQGLTRTGLTVGTVEYMSPEQARGEPLDPRSDLFSLGAVLYELATGDVPFRGATSAVVFAALLGSTPAPPRASNTEVSPGMDAIIRKLLEKRLYARFQSANELCSALSALHAGGPKLAAAAAPVAPVAKPTTVQQLTVTDPTARPQKPSPPSGARLTGTRVRHEMVDEEPRHAEPVRQRIARDEEPQARGGYSRWVLLTVVGLALLGGVGYVLYRNSAPVAGPNVVEGGLLVTGFTNSTGDSLLGYAPATAMQILLRTMPGVNVPDYAPPLGSSEGDAALLATNAGMPEYLTGEVTKDGQRYRVHGAILRTSDHAVLAYEDADAASLMEIPRALSQLAVALRTHMGETPDQANANAVTLDIEGSASLLALNDYAEGIALQRLGRSQAAATQFAKALTDDANFTLARWHLADSLRAAGAEPESVRAAAGLSNGADKGSACLRGAVAYALADAATRLAKAQAWATACPQRGDALVALSRAYLADGHGGEAEAAANKAVALDPKDRTAQVALTLAAITQDHYELALKQQTHAATMGVASPGLLLLAAFLRGDAAAVAQASGDASRFSEWEDGWYYVTYLSSRGQIAEAVHFGEGMAAKLDGQAAVVSSATLMRARLNAIKAITGHCDGVAPLSATSNRAAYFAALAAAWCHRPATDLSPVTNPNMAQIAHGAQAWGAGDAGEALLALDRARSSSEGTMDAMLRGEAHLLQHQQQVAIGDYRAVITHRGAAMLTDTPVFAAAHAGLATAYRSMGDESNSARVQTDLKTLWVNALPTEPLLKRAAR